jgi:hypothetical protein
VFDMTGFDRAKRPLLKIAESLQVHRTWQPVLSPLNWMPTVIIRLSMMGSAHAGPTRILAALWIVLMGTGVAMVGLPVAAQTQPSASPYSTVSMGIGIDLTGQSLTFTRPAFSSGSVTCSFDTSPVKNRGFDPGSVWNREATGSR